MDRLAGWAVRAAFALLIGGLAFAATGTASDVDDALQPVPGPYVANVTDAATAFLALLTDEQRQQALYDFNDPARTSGTDTSQTPSFCAVLAWCVGWGLTQCSLSYPQHVALQRLLSTALSDVGYQTLLAVMNRNRIVGELEEESAVGFVETAGQQCPELSVGSAFEIPDHCVPGFAGSVDNILVGGNTPPDADGNYGTSWAWPNNAPGLDGRFKQYCQYVIAMFGEPGADRWALRFEGHHLTINLTFERTGDDGAYVVHATPLFLGSFPIVIPPAPFPDDLNTQTAWVASQEFMADPVHHVRNIVAGLPDDVRAASFVAAETFEQVAPLKQDAHPPWLLTGLATNVPEEEPEGSVRLMTGDLDETTQWHIAELFRRYFLTMPSDVGLQYQAKLSELLDADTEMSVIWAGAASPESKSNIFLRLVIGPYLVEFLANNQWGTQNRHIDQANHLHSVFRDLSFDWDFDPERPSDQHHDDS